MFELYSKSKIDSINTELSGNLIYAGTVSSNTSAYTISWSGLQYYIGGVRYTPADGSIDANTVLAPPVTGAKLIGDTSGTVSIVSPSTALSSSQILIATFDMDGVGISSRTDEPTGPLVERVGGVSSHNALTGLQGGDALSNEFYHLDANLYNQLQGSVINVGTVSVSGYTPGGNGIVVNLANTHTNTNYGISVTFDVNTANHAAAPETNYVALVTDKTTTSFTVKIIKEYENPPGTFNIVEFDPSTESPGILENFSYVTIDNTYPIVANAIPGYFEIDTVSGGTVPPTEVMVNNVTALSFSGAAANDVYLQFSVPTNYSLGNPIALVMQGYVNDVNPNAVKLDVTSNLFRLNTDPLGTPGGIATNSQVITIPTSTNDLVFEFTIDVVDNNGNIGGVQVGRGDIIGVRLLRDATHANDTSAGDLKIVTFGVRY